MSTSVAFLIREFIPMPRNTLVGFVEVQTPSGVVYHDVSVHRKEGSIWASPASKPRLGRDGTQMKDAAGKGLWTPVVSFASKEVREKWSRAVIDALRVSNPEVLG
jgi:hypothetical protein